MPFLDKCLENCSYRIRDLTAQALVPLIDKSEAPRRVAQLFAQLTDCTISDTRCQGILLQVSFSFHFMIHKSLFIILIILFRIILKLRVLQFIKIYCSIYVISFVPVFHSKSDLFFNL